MRSGITLEMANYTSNLPYLVVAELNDGKEQFLCPVVGEVKPHFGKSMCKQSLINYKNKKIRYGGTGYPPDFVGTSEGTSVRFMNMLAEKLQFNPTLTWSPSYYELFNKVDHLCEESRRYILIKLSLLVQQ